ncbi:glycosyltransferase [Pontiella sulfatireligans]|nr:glycosyltransferase [Pontiella sulfatireligans]
MNIPSHYQNDFFQALENRDDVDLQVVYFDAVPQDRIEEGWKDARALKPYETCVQSGMAPEQQVESINDWRGRIHVSSDNFSTELIKWFCEHDVAWCRWSETPGIRLAELVGYRISLYKALTPLMLACKRDEGKRIKNYALGAFGQGLLARKAFRLMGVPDSMISDLYYVPAGLKKAEPTREIVDFAKGRKVFLSVGALCRRKGIDVLLKAFSLLETKDWCLVLCGFDRSNGAYDALARKLGISDKVLFLGSHPVERIAEVYSASDVFVLASRFDGWGAVLNEAASLGLPLIGTDLCGASWHVIQQGINGFRVKTASVENLSDAMQAYVDSPALVATHGAVSKNRFFAEFTPEKNAERMVDAITVWSRRRGSKGRVSRQSNTIHDSQVTAAPTVSVVIPTYKRLDLLKRAVDSVLAQTYDDWELIISDNESPAGATWDYLLNLAQTSPKITVLQNAGGSGLVSNLNNALSHARGEWVKPLFDDDVLMPDCLGVFLQAVSGHPSVVLAGCLAYRVRPNKHERVDRRPVRKTVEIVEQRYAHLAMYLQDYECGGVPSQMLVRRSAIEAGAVMPEPFTIRGALDSYWYSDILQHGDRLHLALPLIKEYQGTHETLTSELGEDIPEAELVLYRHDIYNYIPRELNAPPPAVIEQMVYGIRGLHKIFIGKNLAGGLKGLFRIRHPWAAWLVFEWVLRRTFPGRFTATPRLRYAFRPSSPCLD